MEKGLLPDTHELAATSTRSLAIGKCDLFYCYCGWCAVEMVVSFWRVAEVIELRRPYLVLNKEIKDDPFCLGHIHPWIEAITNKTLVRYQLPVVVIVFNNGGVYSGDKRNPEDITGQYKDDPTPTSFVPGAAYLLLIEAFGGKGYIFLQESLLLSMSRLIRMLVQKVAGCNIKIEVCKLWFCLHFANVWKNMH
ncbi:putative oxalyl-CoA decarboxylase [Helianthus debilis subsp. tardiflorus]